LTTSSTDSEFAAASTAALTLWQVAAAPAAPPRDTLAQASTAASLASLAALQPAAVMLRHSLIASVTGTV
jgi:hypothetical protein